MTRINAPVWSPTCKAKIFGSYALIKTWWECGGIESRHAPTISRNSTSAHTPCTGDQQIPIHLWKSSGLGVTPWLIFATFLPHFDQWIDFWYLHLLSTAEMVILLKIYPRHVFWNWFLVYSPLFWCLSARYTVYIFPFSLHNLSRTIYKYILVQSHG